MVINWIFPIFIGWLTGWLVNYLSDILPITRRFSKPVCLSCGENYTLKDYLLFRPCPNGHKRSYRVWITQAVIIALTIYIYLNPPSKYGGYWIGMLLLIYFGVVFIVDMEHRLILHETSIVGSIVTLLIGSISHGFVNSLLGGLFGLLIMLVFYFFGVLFTKFRAKRLQDLGNEADDEEALGQGDVILVTILGLLIGKDLVWFMVIISVLFGGIFSLLMVVGLIINRRYSSNALMVFTAYGPYFILGTSMIVYFPEVLRALLPVN